MDRRLLGVLAITTLALVLLGTIPGAADQPQNGTNVTVIDVVDGDTIDVRFPNGTVERVRLIGVDTPETKATVDPTEWAGVPNTTAGREWLRRYGTRASTLTKRLENRTVTIVADSNLSNRGFFGRLLRYVYVDRVSHNERLLERGLARVYDSPFTERDEYERLETRAQANETGVWGFTGNDSMADPTTGSVVTTGVTLDGLQADAPGDEYDNLGGEWVRLRNVRTESINLANWTVRDPAGHVYRFGNRTLAGGATITLVTGNGSDNATWAFQNRSAPVWNNGGDRIIVRNAAGEPVLNASYDASGQVRCRFGIAPIDGAVPIDHDCDGRAEDVDGDGQINILDVATFLDRFDGVPEQEAAAFDFAGDGRLNILDVAALLRML